MSEINHKNKVIESFSDCFANFDGDGVGTLLTPNFDQEKCDRKDYIKYLKSHFEQLKQNGAEKFKVLETNCTGCQCGKAGLLFINEINKSYIAFVIEQEGNKISDLIECVYFETSYDLDDFDRDVIVPFFE